jgi:hypothetical protein
MGNITSNASWVLSIVAVCPSWFAVAAVRWRLAGGLCGAGLPVVVCRSAAEHVIRSFALKIAPSIAPNVFVYLGAAMCEATT